MKVIRATLNNGERIIGMRYPSILIPLVEKTIGEQQSMQQLKSVIKASGLPEHTANMLATQQVRTLRGILASGQS